MRRYRVTGLQRHEVLYRILRLHYDPFVYCLFPQDFKSRVLTGFNFPAK